jgi:MraZ protein
MSWFAGAYEHVLDEKGRTSLPKEFRAQLAGPKPPWMTALRDCLAIFTAEDFEKLQRRLAEASTTIDAIQRLQRLIVGMATPCPFDRQGRILVPPRLREWAFLDREIVFAGVGKRIELWDRGRHRAELEGTRASYGEFANLLREFGL